MTRRIGELSLEKVQRIRKYNRDTYYRHRESRLEKARQNRNNNKERCILQQARCRAKRFNIPFNLELSDIIIPEVCPILNIPLLRSSPGRCDGSPSLDRILPDKGYVKGNIIVISNRANRIKSDATIDELISITEFYKKLIQ